MESPLLDDRIEGVEVVRESGRRRGRGHVTSKDVDAVRDLVPHRRVAETAANRISGSRNDAPLLVAEVILLRLKEMSYCNDEFHNSVYKSLF